MLLSWSWQQQEIFSSTSSSEGSTTLEMSSDDDSLLLMMTTAQLYVEVVYYMSYMMTMRKATSSSTCAINLCRKLSRNWQNSSGGGVSSNSAIYRRRASTICPTVRLPGVDGLAFVPPHQHYHPHPVEQLRCQTGDFATPNNSTQDSPPIVTSPQSGPSSSSISNTNNSSIHGDSTSGAHQQEHQEQQPTTLQQSSSQMMLQLQQSSEQQTHHPLSPPANNNNNNINQLFQVRYRFLFLMTMVALLFSLLLFALLLCWVVFTSAYVVSIDKTCDLPLKTYYWLATIQLVLDVFRTDIMKYVFHWDPITNTDLNNNTSDQSPSSSSRNNTTIPTRVAMYNIAYVSNISFYVCICSVLDGTIQCGTLGSDRQTLLFPSQLTFAFYSLHTGTYSVFRNTSTFTCSQTAPELFVSARSFVCLSISAWITIFLGYALPACFLAFLVASRHRSVTTTADSSSNSVARVAGAFVGVVHGTNGVVGGMHRGDWRNVWNIGRNGAPPECLELLDTIELHDFPEEYPKDCCICMTDFLNQDVILVTPCQHVFHKVCFSEWIDLARTCPICRSDIPNSLGIDSSQTATTATTQSSINNSNRQTMEPTQIQRTESSLFHWRPTLTSSDRLSFLTRGRASVDADEINITSPTYADNEEGDDGDQQSYGISRPGNIRIEGHWLSSQGNRSTSRIAASAGINLIPRPEQSLTTTAVLPFGDDGDSHILPE